MSSSAISVTASPSAGLAAGAGANALVPATTGGMADSPAAGAITRGFPGSRDSSPRPSAFLFSKSVVIIPFSEVGQHAQRTSFHYLDQFVISTKAYANLSFRPMLSR